MPSTLIEPQTVTVSQFARALGISRTLAYDAINRGEVPSIRVGRAVRVPKLELERMLAGRGVS